MVSAPLEPQPVAGTLHLQKLRSGSIYFPLWPTQVAVGLGGELKPHSLPSASDLHPSANLLLGGGGSIFGLSVLVSPSYLKALRAKGHSASP